ncbi:MAG: hypothetical protein MUE68_06725 [Bacteroidetes bacterium]|jgi:hypothetical protein|nr:hypothetical protein [Bacteroidota bacterium]
MSRRRWPSIALMSILAVTSAASQVEAVHVTGGYVQSISERIRVREAHGLTTGVDLRIGLVGDLSLSVGLGYERYEVDQDSALEKWNWIFWNDRYAGLVRSIVRGPDSSIIRSSLVPNQRMQAFPITLALSYPIALGEDVSIVPSLGGGVIFYSRKIYLQETWTRYFASVDHTFGYTFEQFSNPKEGNPFFAMASVDVSVRVSELLRIRAGGRLVQIIPTEGSMGYDEVPFDRSLTGRIALEFMY